MAVSANGLIATSDGSEDFLSHQNWLQFVKRAKEAGCFIYGRKTYEAVIKWDPSYLAELKSVRKMVISSTNFEPQAGFTLAKSPEAALEILKAEGFTAAIVTGGATINSAFAKLGLIDEVILDINPALIGTGVPIFAPTDLNLNLQLRKTENIADGIVEVSYKVVK